MYRSINVDTYIIDYENHNEIRNGFWKLLST